MPSIAQQDYKVIAPKQGRDFKADVAALGELKKAILNGIGFDCIIKDTMAGDEVFNRVLGFYPDGSSVDVWSLANSDKHTIEMFYTVTQYQGLAAVQEAMDKLFDIQNEVPILEVNDAHILASAEDDAFVCIDGKYLLPEKADGKLASITIAETGPGEDTPFVNITWEDAQKLIGLPIA